VDFSGTSVTTPYVKSSGTGTWTQSAGTLDVSGTMQIGYDNTGQCTLSGTAAATIGGELLLGRVVTGTWTQNGGALTVNGATGIRLGLLSSGIGVFQQNSGTVTTSIITMNDAGTGTYNLAGGTLNVADWNMSATGDTVSLTGGVLHTTGAGTIGFSVANNGTTLSPGASIGVTDITGSYTQGSTGRLEIELAGLSVGEFDAISVSTTASLDGYIDVALLGAYTPTPGDSWDILTAASGVTLGSLTYTTNYTGSLVDSGNTLRLTYVPEPVTLGLLSLGGLATIMLRLRRKRSL